MKKIKKVLMLAVMLLLVFQVGMVPVKAAALKSPAGNKLKVASYNSLKLEWKKVSGASGYGVWRKTTGTSFKRIATLSGASKCSYVDKNLSTGTKYAYVVKAYKKSGKKTTWSAASKSLAATPKLSKPVISTVKAAGAGKLAVTWKKVPGASGYIMYRAASKSGSYKRIKTLAGNGKISCTDSKLSAGKTYYYKIKAYRTVKKKNYYSDASAVKGAKAAANVAVTKITLDQSVISIEIGKTYALTATVAPANATDKSVTWSSNNTRVATVTNGTVTGKAAGTATITAVTSNGLMAICTVHVTVPDLNTALTDKKNWSNPLFNSSLCTPVNCKGGPTVLLKSQGALAIRAKLDQNKYLGSTMNIYFVDENNTGTVYQMITISIRDLSKYDSAAGYGYYPLDYSWQTPQVYEKKIRLYYELKLADGLVIHPAGIGGTDAFFVEFGCPDPPDTDVNNPIEGEDSNVPGEGKEPDIQTGDEDSECPDPPDTDVNNPIEGEDSDPQTGHKVPTTEDEDPGSSDDHTTG